jgi:hypothetical protein
VAAPAELSTTVPTEMFDGVLRQAAPQLRGELRRDGRARLRWARRPGWVGLDVAVDVLGKTLWLRPNAVVTGQRRWTLPVRTPAYQIPLPDLPKGILITDVSLEPDCLRVAGLLPEWRMDLPLPQLEDVIRQLSQGALSFAWPSLWRSAD